MNGFPAFLLVGTGSAIGAMLRYIVSMVASRWFGAGFPVGTMFVNLTGSFLMGVLIESISRRATGGDALRLFLATGVLGGYTTFSSFSLDVAVLTQRSELIPALAYLLLSVVGGILALFAGLAAVRHLL